MTRLDRLCLVVAVIAVAVVVGTRGCDDPRFQCQGYDEMACHHG